MSKRRTSGIQRRQRASTEALNRRVQSSSAGGLPLDWRILLIGGVLLIGAIVLVVVLVLSGGPNPNVGERQVSDPAGHVPACTPNYSSTPPTSGCHLDTPANWGVYTVAQDPTPLVHNLEHGGIVIWYQPDQVSEEEVAAMSDLVEAQLAEGTGGRFEFILSPWVGEDFGSPIAVTSWEWLLYLDTADLDAISSFAGEHYGLAPEPNGGPGL